jgi:hypothetical protein
LKSEKMPLQDALRELDRIINDLRCSDRLTSNTLSAETEALILAVRARDRDVLIRQITCVFPPPKTRVSWTAANGVRHTRSFSRGGGRFFRDKVREARRKLQRAAARRQRIAEKTSGERVGK